MVDKKGKKKKKNSAVINGDGLVGAGAEGGGAADILESSDEEIDEQEIDPAILQRLQELDPTNPDNLIIAHELTQSGNDIN